MINKRIIQLKIDIKSRPDFIFTAASSSIFFALLLMLPIYDKFLVYLPGIDNFSNHVMSAASAANLDIAARINSYLLMLFGVLAVVLIFFALFYIKFNNCYKSGIDEKVKGFIRDASLIGIAAIIASIFTTSKDFAAYYIGIAAILGWIFLMQKDDRKDFDMLIWSLLISAPFAIFIYVLSMRYDFITKLFQKWIIQQQSQVSFVAVAVFAWVLTSILSFFFQQKVLSAVSKSKIKQFDTYKTAIIISGIPFLFTGIVQSILLEILNILNKDFDVVFGRPRLIYTGFMLFAAAISVLLFICLRNKKNGSSDAGDLIYKLYMPVILITFACMLAQPCRMTSASNEFFEMANHGLAVDQFFRFGTIPIIQSFDAHMMSNQIFAYFYSLLNGYEPWAAFSYSSFVWLLYVVPIFYILRKIIGATNSFLMILCFPLLTNLFNMVFLLSGLVAICIIRMISSHKVTDYYLFWITAVLLCIYRLDLGFAALLGGIAVYFITCFTFKEKTDIKKLFLTGAITDGIALLLFALLCLLEGINPINRFVEFIKLCLSNQSWAGTSVGNSDMLAYVMGYYVLPLFVLVCAVWIVAKNAILNRDQDSTIDDSNLSLINKDAFIMFIFFTAFFIFNASRGIVRHSFQENTIIIITGTIPLAVLSLAVINKKSNFDMLKFLATAMAIIIMINVNVSSYKGLGSSLVSNAISSPSYQEQYTPAYAFNGTRVRGSVMPPDAENLKSILDTVLTQQETYFDFASVNYFYALVGRRNPVYVNQSPLMICDDSTQKYALQQIKATEPPVVLMPIDGNVWSSIDGIPVDYKYYMISEYIYKNYTPLIRLPMFDIYCLKEKKDSYANKLAKSGLITKTLYSGCFDFVDRQQLSYNNCTAKIDNDKNLVLVPSGNDPYVFGFMGQLREKYPKEKNNVGTIKPSQIKIDFYSKSAGSIQLFYTLNENEMFSEQKSKVFPIYTEGQHTAVLDLPSVPNELRIDVDTQELLLKHLTISQGLQAINNQPEIWVRNLGEIPRLWAEKDRNKVFLLAPLLQLPEKDTTSFTANTINIPSNEPMYLLLQLNSAADCTATVDIGESQSKLGEFKFTVSKGRHSYAIRLSTDYHWWNNEKKYISVATSQPVTINKYCFIPVDSSKYYNTDSSYFLSNLTDSNWHGGVGVTMNAVLFDNSPRNKNILQSATELVFDDGRVAKILSIRVDGAYIQVVIDGEVNSLANVVSYPNNFKIK